jgi:hypothetical protein
VTKNVSNQNIYIYIYIYIYGESKDEIVFFDFFPFKFC